MKSKKNRGMKVFLSILCVIFAFAFALLSVAKLTVFNESYFEKQMQKQGLSASLTDELNQELQSKIPVSIGEQNQQTLEQLTNSIVEQTSTTLTKSLYHYDQWDKNVEQLKDDLTQTVSSAIEQAGVKLSSFTSAIEPIVHSAVDTVMESDKVQKIQRLSSFLNEFDTPVTIGLFVCGIILAFLIVLLYVLRGTKGIVISLVVSAILLALSALVASFLPDMQFSSAALQTTFAQYKDSLVNSVALSGLFSLAAALLLGIVGLIIGKTIDKK